MSQPKCEVKTTRLSILPFKNMKKVKSHTDSVNDCCTVLFPDGKIKIVTCSYDKTFHTFDLKTLKLEKIINHSHILFIVHFYKEKQLLMTLDYNGELCFWDLFSSEIRIVKKIRISRRDSYFKKLTQISSNFFFCGCSGGPSKGNLYSIKIRNKNINEIKIKEIDYPLKNNKKVQLICIYKLKREKNTILFGGGQWKDDCTIKKFNFETKKHCSFPEKHFSSVLLLISYFNEKNEEIIISGSYDKSVLFWTLDGKNIKEIKLNGYIECFLNDLKRNNIFLTTSYNDGNDSYCLYSLNLKTEKIVKNVEKIHIHFVPCMKWINEENQNKFITCSDDKTFIIFELEKFQNKYENEDLKERINDLRDKEFILENLSSENINKKKMIFSIKFLNSVEIERVFRTLLI